MTLLAFTFCTKRNGNVFSVLSYCVQYVLRLEKHHLSKKTRRKHLRPSITFSFPSSLIFHRKDNFPLILLSWPSHKCAKSINFVRGPQSFIGKIVSLKSVFLLFFTTTLSKLRIYFFTKKQFSSTFGRYWWLGPLT